MRKIGLLGGTFDPIHKAHIDIAKCAIAQLGLDEVQLIPTKNNPWKVSSYASGTHRCAMIRLAIDNEKTLSLNTIELDNESDDKNYTIDTITQLCQMYPQTQYYYIMGMDQANAFAQWKEAEQLSQRVQLVAFERQGYIPKMDVLETFHFCLLEHQALEISSEAVRHGHIEMIDSAVLAYITQEGLYLKTLIANRMTKRRWEHTCSVAELCVEIARSQQLNEKQAYIAAMFHDIAKELPVSELESLMKIHYPNAVNKPKPTWHQWISRYISETEYFIHDEVILKAIEDHTTAALDISTIGKCLYVADKLDPLREYDSSQLIALCKKDIHEGFKACLMNSYGFIKTKDQDTEDIYDHFVIKGEI